MKDQSRPGEGGSDRGWEDAGPSLPNLPGYVVLMITRAGMPSRKVYLDLGHARAAVARARGKGQAAWLVLCRLEPVPGDLDVDGGDQHD